MRETPGIHELPNEDPQALAERLRREGWHVYVLSPDARDKASFFAAVINTLPLDPPWEEGNYHVWDALSDSLNEGLYESDHDRIAILWPESRRMAETAPDDFENARGVLAHVANGLSKPEATLGRPKTLMVALM
jgi:Barstar (barnase inhibitor)